VFSKYVFAFLTIYTTLFLFCSFLLFTFVIFFNLNFYKMKKTVGIHLEKDLEVAFVSL